MDKAIIGFYNMGGPESVADVQRFLMELFNDNDLLDAPFGKGFQNFLASRIVKKRIKEVESRYKQIGGKSPQLGITKAVGNAVLDNLKLRNLPVEIADIVPVMRYSSPSTYDLLRRAANEQIEEVWFMSQYPHCSRATTGTSLREVGLLRSRYPEFAKLRIRTFGNYFDDPAFIDMWAKRISAAWEGIGNPNKFLLISAHNLPLSYISEGDPYAMQIYRTAREVCRRIGLRENIHWSLAWQSSVGPVKWMKPDTRDEMKRLRKLGAESLLVWPLAFVSDHIETLHEVDIEFAEIAHGLGFKTFSRVRNLNDDGDFVEFLTNRISTGIIEKERYGLSPLLRDLDAQPAGEGCHTQPASCLCGRYFTSGSQGLDRGVVPQKMPPSVVPEGGHEKIFAGNNEAMKARIGEK